MLPMRTAIRPSRLCEIVAELPAMRSVIRQNIPPRAGVYGFYNAAGQLQYVGKSKSLRHRLLSYFARRPANEKMARIAGRAAFLRWQVVAGELLALLREQELISRHRPVLNRRGQPRSRRPRFLSITNEGAPRIVLSRSAASAHGESFGPIMGGRRLRRAVEDLTHVFELRDCKGDTPMFFADQLSLFEQPKAAGCLRAETGSCTGPCGGLVTAGAYRQQVEAAGDFLAGRDECQILCRLEQQMYSAAQQRAFEWAARLRDRWNNLRWLRTRLAEVRLGREQCSAVYPLAGFGRTDIWLYLQAGVIAAVSRQPRSGRDRRRALMQLDLLERQPSIHAADCSESVLMQLIVLGWLRLHPQQREALLPLQTARQLC
ncbi:MAG: GIY-YIG nuclease family protein, partial [Pirellulales bacterium]|nr:GIY-YIG nuclease family protein [Pirellulales bacterium]